MQSPALFCAVSILLSAGFVKKILGRKEDFCYPPRCIANQETASDSLPPVKKHAQKQS